MVIHRSLVFSPAPRCLRLLSTEPPSAHGADDLLIRPDELLNHPDDSLIRSDNLLIHPDDFIIYMDELNLFDVNNAV